MKTAQINLYSFDELIEASKERATHEHSIFLNEVDAKGREFSVTETIESIKANEYLFFADGTLAPCVTYTGKHEKAGITELKFHGQVITL